MAAVRCRCAKNPWDLSAWALSCSLDLKIVVTLLTPFKTKTKTKKEFQTRVWPTRCLIKANTLQKPYNINAFDQTLKNCFLNNIPPKAVVVIYNCCPGEGFVAYNHVCFAWDPLEQAPPAWALRSLFELVTPLFVSANLSSMPAILSSRDGGGPGSSNQGRRDAHCRTAFQAVVLLWCGTKPRFCRGQTVESGTHSPQTPDTLSRTTEEMLWDSDQNLATHKSKYSIFGRNRFPGKVSIYITCYPIPALSAIYDIHIYIA